MTIFDFLVCVAIGFAAGSLGGMLGIGGGLIMIPAMAVLFGNRLADEAGTQHLYQAAAMIINIVVAVSALSKHLKEGAVRFDALKGMVIAAIITIGLGVWLSNQIDGEQLARIFALFLAYVVFVNARRLKGEVRTWLAERESARQETAAAERAAQEEEAQRQAHKKEAGSSDTAESVGTDESAPDRDRADDGESDADARVGEAAAPAAERIPLTRSAFVGSIVGTIAGLLGIGGGAIAVPLQQMVFRGITLQQCIGTSIAVMSITAGVGALLKNLTLPEHGVSIVVSLKLALALLPGALTGGYLGAIFTHRLPTPLIRAVFIVLLAVAAANMAGLF